MILNTVSFYLVEYTVETTEDNNCEELKCKDVCTCRLCICGSVYSEICECPVSIKEPNEKMAQLLGLGDDNYRFDKKHWIPHKCCNQINCLHLC